LVQPFVKPFVKVSRSNLPGVGPLTRALGRAGEARGAVYCNQALERLASTSRRPCFIRRQLTASWVEVCRLLHGALGKMTSELSGVGLHVGLSGLSKEVCWCKLVQVELVICATIDFRCCSPHHGCLAQS
jgi:hypothetical protein